jgi:diguanylate cyclase (GGDEF)-like protein
MIQLLRILDFFIPKHLKNSPADLMRCYVLLGVLFSNLIFSFIAIIALNFALALEPEIKHIGISIVSLTFIGYSLTLIVFKYTQNVKLAATCFILVMVITIYPPVFVTGGYQESPVVQMYMLVPVTAFLLSGLIGGLFWTIFTIACCIGLAIAYNANWMHVQLVDSQALINLMRVGLNIMLFCMVAGVLVVYELINENLKNKLHEERSKFEHRASHDALTSIPNRFEFFRRLNTGINECANRQQKLAVVYIDLDGFKPVNDQYGHHAGDELLKVISHRLKTILRSLDTVARIGGDEFALILPGIHVPADIDLVMSKVLATIREPITIDEHEVVVCGSAGISVFPDHSKITDTLCKQADKAMYKAKEQHDTYVYYSPV